MFPDKFPNVAAFTLCVCTAIIRQSHISSLRLSRHLNCSNTNNSDQISVQKCHHLWFERKKMTFSIKLDENYNCVFKIMLILKPLQVNLQKACVLFIFKYKYAHM